MVCCVAGEDKKRMICAQQFGVPADLGARPSRVKPRIHTLGASVRFKKYAKKDKEMGIQISLSDHFATMRG